jgi:hypothetical protein
MRALADKLDAIGEEQKYLSSLLPEHGANL